MFIGKILQAIERRIQETIAAYQITVDKIIRITPSLHERAGFAKDRSRMSTLCKRANRLDRRISILRTWHKLMRKF